MAADLATDLAFAGPAALARLVRAREVTARELVELFAWNPARTAAVPRGLGGGGGCGVGGSHCLGRRRLDSHPRGRLRAGGE